MLGLELLIGAAVAAVCPLVATLPLDVRQRAVDAWRRAREVLGHADEYGSGDVPAILDRAVKVFRQNNPRFKFIRQLRRLIQRWGPRYDETGCIQEQRKGRVSKISDEEADQCIKIMRDGFKTADGRQWRFASIADALARSKVLRGHANHAKLSPRGFWRRLKRRDPKLTYKSIRLRRLLTREQKRRRRAFAQYMLDLAPTALRDGLLRTFFVDAKTMHFNVRSGKFISFKGLNETLASPNVYWKSQDVITIKYYAAVNAFVGPVMYTEVTGTTGLKGRRFKVRVTCCSWVCT